MNPEAAQILADLLVGGAWTISPRGIGPIDIDSTTHSHVDPAVLSIAPATADGITIGSSEAELIDRGLKGVPTSIDPSMMVYRLGSDTVAALVSGGIVTSVAVGNPDLLFQPVCG